MVNEPFNRHSLQTVLKYLLNYLSTFEQKVSRLPFTHYHYVSSCLFVPISFCVSLPSIARRASEGPCLTKVRVNQCIESLCQSVSFTQNKPNLVRRRRISSYGRTKAYKNEHRFLAQKSQSQFSKRQNEHKLLFNNELCLSAEALAKAETNPKQTQFYPPMAGKIAPSLRMSFILMGPDVQYVIMDKKGKYTYDWPRPMVSVDIAVFTYSATRMADKSTTRTADKSEDKAELLLIKRGNEPFKGRWALPGGFVEMDEELEDSAARELAEETGLKGVPLEQLHTFGDVGRDPRGRQITIVFTGIAKSGQDKIKAGDDAAEACWFDIEKLPKDLAFDHNEITKFAIEKLKG